MLNDTAFLAFRLVNVGLRSLGFELHRKSNSRVVGSYPPLEEYYLTGSPDDHYIHHGYESRLQNAFFDDRSVDEEWQKEVYQFAQELVEREQLKSVCDIGCGSGFKLMKALPISRKLVCTLSPRQKAEGQVSESGLDGL